MNSNTQILCSRLTEAIYLLSKYHELEWSKILHITMSKIKAGDLEAIDDLIGLFSGVGGFQDLLIKPLAGMDMPDEKVDAVNDKLSSLRSEIFELAQQIRQG